jgi:hypothetical protein
MTSRLVELAERVTTECQRHQIQGGWECHRCGSLWSDMLMGLGWFPLSCPERTRAASEPSHGG